MQSLSATVKLREDPKTGDLFLPIPDAWLEVLDWRVGDTLKWRKRSRGGWVLTNLSKSERDRLLNQTDYRDAAKGSRHERSRHDPAD